MEFEPFESVLGDIASKFEVLDVAYLNDFVGPCHPDFYKAILKACRTNGKRTKTNDLYKIEMKL
jgi:hypothetical protein